MTITERHLVTMSSRTKKVGGSPVSRRTTHLVILVLYELRRDIALTATARDHDTCSSQAESSDSRGSPKEEAGVSARIGQLSAGHVVDGGFWKHLNGYRSNSYTRSVAGCPEGVHTGLVDFHSEGELALGIRNRAERLRCHGQRDLA